MTLLAGSELPLVEAPTSDEVVVAYGEVPAVGGPVVRFAERRKDPRELLVAIRRANAWRRAPWPAADSLFDMRPPSDDAPVLVIHADAEGRDEMTVALRAHGVPTVEAERLGVAQLEAAGTVLYLDNQAFPATAPAVCAAGRLVILPSVQPLFGLQEGIDCLVARGHGEVIALAQAVVRAPRAFNAIRAMARLAAAPYRASEVYARLALDVSLGVGVDRARRPLRN